jgi:hypothetical protein
MAPFLFPRSSFRRTPESRNVRCACTPPLSTPSPLRERARERVRMYRLRRYLEGFDAAGRAAAGYSSLFAQRRVARRKRAPEPPKSTCASRRSRGLPDGTSLVPLAGSRSRREPRYARPDPPSAAMLGGGYGSQRQRRQLKMCSPDEAQRNPGSIPGFRFTPSGLRCYSE